ncbi:TPA: hypothetical protein DDW35_02745 [Candidatus Sumerlaeota bacterium]|jgi:signal transduction histidine kinase|nr:hypothetical protein [Candidatus Sumerlaeota bacterium]
MTQNSIELLLVEDNPGDARLIQEHLRDADIGRFHCVWAQLLSEALDNLSMHRFDVVLSDLTLPDSQGLATFDRIHLAAPGTPVLVLTGLNDQELALQAVRNGAQEYLVKGEVEAPLLKRVIRYAIERNRIQAELRDLNTNLECRVAERTQELTTAYEALAKANQELHELDKMKSAFIDVTSHELRTPVQILKGMMQILQMKTPDGNAELLHCLQSSSQAVRRLERIVAKALKIGEDGQSYTRMTLQAVAILDVIEAAAREVQPFVELRNQRLMLSAPTVPLTVSIDRDKIQDVLVNLLTNAIKFTPDGGCLRVTAELKGSNLLEVHVIDNGTGINDKDLPHLFEPFFSSLDVYHHSTGEYEFQKRGIGLGLALVRKFVEMHGGKVGMMQNSGGGSDFFFTIPVAPPAASNQTLSAESSSAFIGMEI